MCVFHKALLHRDQAHLMWPQVHRITIAGDENGGRWDVLYSFSALVVRSRQPRSGLSHRANANAAGVDSAAKSESLALAIQ